MKAPETIRLSEYKPPEFLIHTVNLDFHLNEDDCEVVSELAMVRNPVGEYPTGSGPLTLHGRELELLGVTLNGSALSPSHWTLTDEQLTIHEVPETFTLRIHTRIRPQLNTALEGLYRSGQMFCTQCEAEGFRKITYYLDRPDVMAKFTTTIHASQAEYPVLLSNGNPIDQGREPDGRHWVRWEDPYPKPSYLFALVAGDLKVVEDTYVTASGRSVALRFYVEAHNVSKCAHAMTSLQNAMRWDEEVFGLEYDLDIYMVVAVDAFNMGAMENKGLNVFNSKYVLADPSTATDADYANIESVIAHEYFHNWTGNRVTCRDWFQLSLKEGLTVFRDQEFSSDLRSRPVQRIQDVRVLRNAQFKEDAGPTAHQVRPESYIEINNFYTVTIYNKGAEVVRMMHRMLGQGGFAEGMKLYFHRHDGQAVTTDDFVAAMETAGDRDFQQFRRWYSQAGTPRVEVSERFDADRGRYQLSLRQTPPAVASEASEPFHIPIAIGLLDNTGASVPINRGSNDGDPHTEVLELTERDQVFTFDGLDSKPVASVLRGFTAPVQIEFPRSDAELAFLAATDPDEFNRWDAGQKFIENALLATIRDASGNRDTTLKAHSELLVDTLEKVLADRELDPALAAQMFMLPSESYIADQLDTVDVEAIHESRRALHRIIAVRLHDAFLERYHELTSALPYHFDTAPAAARALRNVCLGYLVEVRSGPGPALGKAQFDTADNMTDSMAALAALCDHDTDERTAALSKFESKWYDEPLVLDKWFTLQALSRHNNALDEVKRLLSHPRYDGKNPNRVRSLIGAFSQNQRHFHTSDASGYRFLAKQLVELDPINPQVAARLSSAFSEWRRFGPRQQGAMKDAMEYVQSRRPSRDTFEILSRILSAPAR